MKKIYGVGLVDLPYKKKIRDSKGKTVWFCPYFSKWRDMVRRCYSEQELERNPSYKGCTVCEEWLTFSNFRSWMEGCDWEGKELDKDIIGTGNHYSPDNCVWVPHLLNVFISGSTRKDRRSPYPGVIYQKDCGKWRAQCSNPFAAKGTYERRGYMGLYSNPKDAYIAYISRKCELVCELSYGGYIEDEKVKQALRERYNKEIEKLLKQ